MSESHIRSRQILTTAAAALGGCLFVAGMAISYQTSNVHNRSTSALTTVAPPVKEVPPLPTHADITSISSSDMLVQLSTRTPVAFQYTLKKSGQFFTGAHKDLSGLIIDGKKYVPEVTFKKTSQAQAVYTLKVPKVASFNVTASTVGNQFSFELSNIKELGDTKIHTIGFADQSMIAVRNTDAHPKLASVQMYTATSGSTKGKNGDNFIDLSKAKPGSTHAMYAFLSTDKVASGIWTNASQDGKDKNDNNRLNIKTEKTNSGTWTGLSSNYWTVRPVDSDSSPINEFLPNPKETIVITDKAHHGKKTTWQDSAIALRSVMNKPLGWQDTRRSVVQRIPENFASNASNPFTRTLDETKRVYNITDGLGQAVTLKGYQNEGHDSGHPDYASIGLRQGGLTDFKTLLDGAHDLNTSIGVHINDSETYPESKNFDPTLANLGKPGWDWLDPSYKINQRYDAISLRRYNRLKELKKVAPTLDFIYVDVWGDDQEQGWESRRIGAEITSLGWPLHTEYGNQLEYDSTWGHWAAEKAYGGTDRKGFNSNIVRFLRNNEKDTWVSADNSLLGGAEFESEEGWVGKTNFNQFVKTTYQIDLPTKFLQHFDIIDWQTHWDNKKKDTIGSIKLSDNVIVKNPNNTRTITMNGKVVLTDPLTYTKDGVIHHPTYLLPWDSSDKMGNGFVKDTPNTSGKNFDKLYYWSDNGKPTTWKLTPRFAEATTLHCYELTDQGRIDLGTIPVTDGSIQLSGKAHTPYLLTITPNQTKSPSFGTGTVIKDPGFNQKDTIKTNWTVKTGAPYVKKDHHGHYVLNSGNDKLSMTQNLEKLPAGNYSLYVGTSAHNKPTTVSIKSGAVSTKHTFKDASVQNYIQNSAFHTVGKEETKKSYMQNGVYTFWCWRNPTPRV